MNQIKMFNDQPPRNDRAKKVISEFQRIKSIGFIKSTRPKNKDGGIGNTFEDYLGVKENNLREPDFIGFEVKTKKALSKAVTSLFSKSPTYPKKANAYLKDTFGEARDPEFPDLKKLYASMFGNRDSFVYEKYYMRLSVDRKNELLRLIVKDINQTLISDNVYWSFDNLRKASMKIKDMIYVSAETKKIDDIYHYHFNSAKILLDFNFDKFIDMIENGSIQFDLRMGVYKSGSRYGYPHDHGSGFRVKKENINDLYDQSFEI